VLLEDAWSRWPPPTGLCCTIFQSSCPLLLHLYLLLLPLLLLVSPSVPLPNQVLSLSPRALQRSTVAQACSPPPLSAAEQQSTLSPGTLPSCSLTPSVPTGKTRENSPQPGGQQKYTHKHTHTNAVQIWILLGALYEASYPSKFRQIRKHIVKHIFIRLSSTSRRNFTQSEAISNGPRCREVADAEIREIQREKEMLPSFLAGRTFCPVSCVDSSPDVAGDSADLLLPAGQHSTGCTGRQLPAPDPLPAQVNGTGSRPGTTVENRHVSHRAHAI
jgi:hypothetical protein